ncbi:putative molybdenum carrier protein [Bacteroidota bacterium]
MSKIKIISGGQTGVDQGALDFALDLHFECGGHCPKGRKSEMGIIPFRYPVVEIESEEYIDRTRKNIIESDGTLVIKDQNDFGEGTLEAIGLCEQFSKPYIIIETDTTINAGYKFRKWIVENHIKVLNVAGNRQSESPDIRGKTYILLIKLFDV